MLDPSHRWNIRVGPLVIGFASSVVLTVLAYVLALYKVFSGFALIGAVLGLAGAQCILQLIYFFHLGIETKPRWNLIHFLFLVLVVVVVIGGSLWIMANLNYNMMPEMSH